MASYYLPTIAVFAEGNVTSISDSAIYPTMIAGVLEKLDADGGMKIEVVEHMVNVVSETSAIVWITLKSKGIVWTNVYFFRRTESGKDGWEGGIFDGENRMLRELRKE